MISEIDFFDNYTLSDQIDLFEPENFNNAIKALNNRLNIVPESALHSIDVEQPFMGLNQETYDAMIKHVWTITDDGDNMFATGGFHLVNRQAFILTDKPWREGDNVAEYYIAIDPVTDGDDEQSQINKLDEALERGMYHYIMDNFVDHNRLMDRVRTEAKKSEHESLFNMLSYVDDDQSMGM